MKKLVFVLIMVLCAISVLGDTNQTDLWSSIIGLYSFDETSGTVAEEGKYGIYNLTCVACEGNEWNADGKFNYSSKVDANNEYLRSLSGIQTLNTTNVTLSFWIRNIADGYQLTTATTGNDLVYFYIINTGNRIINDIDNAGAYIYEYAHNLSDDSPQSWSHVVMVMGDGNWSLWVNGTMGQSTTGNGKTLSDQSDFEATFGVTSGLQWFDEAYFFNVSLNPDQIQWLYNNKLVAPSPDPSGWDAGVYNRTYYNTTGFLQIAQNYSREFPDDEGNTWFDLGSNCISLLHFNNDSSRGENNSLIRDYCNNQNYTINGYGVGIDYEMDSDYEGFMDYDSGGSYLVATYNGVGSVNASVDEAGDISASMWWRHDYLHAFTQYHLRKVVGANSDFFWLNNHNNDYLVDFGDCDIDTNFTRLNHFPIYPVNWNHIVFTYDNSSTTGKLYLNGKYYAGKKKKRNAEGAGQVSIEDQTYSCGAMDELLLVDKVLNEEEITRIYRMQRGHYYGTYTTEIFSNATSSWNVSWELEDNESCFGKALPNNGVSDCIDMSSNVLLVHFDEEDGNFKDEAGYGSINLSRAGMVDYNVNRSIFNRSMLVQSNDYEHVNITHDGSLQVENVTLSVWFQSFIFAPPPYGYAYKIYSAPSAGDIYLMLYTTTGANMIGYIEYADSSTDTIQSDEVYDNGWHNYVLRYNGTEFCMFVDGVKQADIETKTSTIKTDSNNLASIASINANQAWPGIYDELAVFNQPLSDAEINHIYERGIYRLGLEYQLEDDGTWLDSDDNISPVIISDTADKIQFRWTLSSAGSDFLTIRKAITDDHILKFYNFTVESSLLTSPSASLTTPPDNHNITEAPYSIILNASCTDIITNASLLIDGVRNTTNTSQAKGSHPFFYDMTDNQNLTIKWGVECCNGLACNTTSNRTLFTYYDPELVSVNFSAPTPGDGAAWYNSSIVINVSIWNGADLNNFTFDWDGTNYTPYDSSLLRMFNFDNVSSLGDSVTLATDATGNENGSIVRNPFYVTGKYGKALSFLGTNGTINLGNSSDLEVQYLTMCSWVKNPTYQGALEGGITKGRVFGTYNQYSYGIRFTSNTATFAILNATAGNFDSVSVGDANWHWYCGIANATHVTIYKDGVSSGSPATRTVTIVHNLTVNNNLTVGGRIGLPSYSGNATFDEIRIWNRSLSQAEISRYYKSNLAMYDTEEWSYYISQDVISGIVYTYQGWAKGGAEVWGGSGLRTLNATLVPAKLQMWRNASSLENVSWVDNDGNWYMRGHLIVLNLPGCDEGDTIKWHATGALYCD